jgi:hypothetical protein
MNQLDAKMCIAMLKQFANAYSRFSASFAAFGAFPTTQGVVYLSPTPTELLFSAHRDIHQRLSSIGAQVHEYYWPNSWLPHATIGFELPSTEVALALSWLHKNFKPVQGKFVSVGLIEFTPVKELAAFELRAPTTASTPTRARAPRAGKAAR